jgi:hypothetical protein
VSLPVQPTTNGSVAGRHLRRSSLLIAIAIVALIIPATVLAVISPFSDVSPTNTFYNNIVNMANTGITSGCGGGKFCPKDNVTREQMSAFLNRAAPRATSTNFHIPFGQTPGGQAPNGGTVASVTVKSLGNEYLYISTAFFTLTYNYSPGGIFPCENAYRFKVDGTLVSPASMYDRQLAKPVNTWATTQVAGETLTPVGAGNHTVTLVYYATGSCSNYPGTGSMTVMVIPFDGSMNSY